MNKIYGIPAVILAFFLQAGFLYPQNTSTGDFIGNPGGSIANPVFDHEGRTPTDWMPPPMQMKTEMSTDSAGWTSIGPYGGDVLDVAVSTLDPATLIAAAGYPYISHDGGQNWELLAPLATLANNSIHTVECTADGIFFAGGTYLYGKGYKSQDGGETWQVFNYSLNSSIQDIACDPQDPEILYCGMMATYPATASKVVIKSVDGGQTWTVLDLTAALPLGYGVIDVAVSPVNGQTVFAVGREGISNALVAASFDGGATWENRSGNLPSGKPYNAVALAGHAVYLAGGQLFGSQNLGLYRSMNGGLNWQNISASFPKKVENDILVDPSDTNKIFVATEGDGVYFSTDWGVTWTYQTQGEGDNGPARCLAHPPSGTDTLYAGFLSLALCKTTDGGLSWTYANHGIATLLINDINVDRIHPMTILAGFEAENSGGCYFSQDGAETWTLMTSLPATRFSVVGIDTAETLYAWSNGPSSVAQEGLYKSTDLGLSWTNMGPNIGSLFETEIFALELSETNSSLIFIGGNNFGVNGFDAVMYRTTDAGATWDSIYVGPAYNSVLDIHILPGTGDQEVVAAFKSDNGQGGFMKSTDGGTTWTVINNGIPAGCKHAASVPSPAGSPDLLYGGIGGSGDLHGTVVVSLDGGDTWTDTPLSLNNYSRIPDLLVHPGEEGVVYAASSQDGVYYSVDYGATWYEYNDGLPAANITSFSDPYLIGGTWRMLSSTYTHSAFRAEVLATGPVGVPSSVAGNLPLSIYPNPCHESITVEMNTEAAGDGVLEILTMQGTVVFRQEFTAGSSGGAGILVHVREAGLQPGVYLCRVLTGDRSQSARVVVL